MMSSNDYYGALNRRFDGRMKRLSRIAKRQKLEGCWGCIRYINADNRWVVGANARVLLTNTQVMNMPNRVYSDLLRDAGLLCK
jgi:hypothetical protein